MTPETENIIRDYINENRITLRDQFAMRALEGFIIRESRESEDIPLDIEDIARLSYLFADEMLEARKKNQK